MTVFVDGHLDLAYNAGLGHDLTLPLDELRARAGGPTVPMVTFPALRAGGVGLCLGTIFTMPHLPDRPEFVGPSYRTASEARAQGLAQLDVYRRWQDAGHLTLLRGGAAVGAHLRRYAADPETTPLGVVLLMEGADPIAGADDLPFWVEAGVRLIGLAWRRTRAAGGTGEPGGLSAEGRELLSAMRQLGVPLDASHLAEQSFWEALELTPQVFASHSNARALVNTDRQLSDPMLRAIAERGGMVGAVLYNGFIQAGWQRGDPPTPRPQVAALLAHLAAQVGWAQLGIGSDMDGGFGAHEMPGGLDSAADFAVLGECVPPGERAGVLGDNWARWLEEL